MANKVYVVYLLLILTTVCHGWSLGGVIAGVACAAVAPFAIPAALGAAGFTAGGIVAGSAAASAMAYTAPVAAQSLVAIGQSVGAAGLGLAGKVIAGGVGYAAYCTTQDC